MSEKGIPCRDCITLAMCKSRYTMLSGESGVVELVVKCSLLKSFVTYKGLPRLCLDMAQLTKIEVFFNELIKGV
jgi:hypothetical protein